MKEKLEAIKAEALSKIENAHELTLLNDVKVAVLGKKGELTQVLKGMKDVAPEDRPKVGQFVNEARASYREDEERDHRRYSSGCQEGNRSQTSKPDRP